YAEAESAYRDALKLDPDYPEALCNLGNALYLQGRFEEALPNIRRGHELGTKRPDWEYLSADWVRGAEQAVELDRRFAAVVAGQATPKDSADLMLLARFGANQKKQYANVAQMFSDAFRDHPVWVSDRGNQCYFAACTAVMAAAASGPGGIDADAERQR